MTGIERFFLTGLGFLATIVLARLLSPLEFGLIAILVVFYEVGRQVIDGGLGLSIIREKEADDRDFSTVFYASVVMAIAFYGFLFAIAPFVARFYEEPILEPLLRVYGLMVPVSAFTVIQRSIMLKRVQFKRLALMRVPGHILGAALGITMAWQGFGVWSIVAYHFSRDLIMAIFFWIASSWHPSLTFDKLRFRHHYSFGYKLMFTSLLGTLSRELYSLVIGKQFSVETLGQYRRSKVLVQFPSMALGGVIQDVTYPLLSRMQDNPERLARSFRSLVRSVSFVSMPMMATLIVTAGPLIELVLGTQWLGAVPIFQVLCVSGAVIPLHAVMRNLLNVFGRSDLALRLAVLTLCASGVVLVIGVLFGFYALLWGSVSVAYLALLVNGHYVTRLMERQSTHPMQDVLPSLVAAMSVTAGGIWIASQLEAQATWLQVVILVPITLAAYLLLNVLGRNPALPEFRDHLRSLRRST